METTRYSLLTPKEKVRLVLNSAFATNFEKYVKACKTKRESQADEGKAENDNPDSPIQSDEVSAVESTVESSSVSLQWHPSEFYVSMLNFSLGYGTVLGFPRLCFKHGGG